MSLNLNFYMENTLLSEKGILQNSTRSKILFGGNHTFTNIHVYKRKCFYECYGFSLKHFMLSVRVCIIFCFLNTMKTKNRVFITECFLHHPWIHYHFHSPFRAINCDCNIWHLQAPQGHVIQTWSLSCVQLISDCNLFNKCPLSALV